MAAGDDPTLARDVMLTRMAMATPGGALFRTNPPDFPKFELTEDSYPKEIDEAQSFAASRKGLIAHTALMRLLGGWAIQIRRELAAGRTVVLSVEGREIARFEP